MKNDRRRQRSSPQRLPPAVRPEDVAFLKGKVVLVTGGTGSFGNRFVDVLLKESKVAKLIVLSRDELKQSEMAARIKDKRLRFFLGDIRDPQRLQRAFHGVDYVVHAAALKQVPTLEYNPFEAVQTNIIGAQNIVNAAIDQKVGKILALSTDKAANPINLYGATKLCAEKLFIAGNSYAASAQTRFAVSRYGNVIGSRGSVIPLFLRCRGEGVIPVTDRDMTRFWLTLDQGVWLVVRALREMLGGEVFVPKIPSMRMMDLARTVAPDCKIRFVGIRPGEKLHEVLLTEDESARGLDVGEMFLIKPNFPKWGTAPWPKGTALSKGFRYASDTNDDWLTPAELSEMIRPMTKDAAPVPA